MKLCATCHEAPCLSKRKTCSPCHAAYMREWRKTHPLDPEQRKRDNARSYAGVYKRRGILVPQPCVDCGISPEDELIEMHHVDYNRPLDVTWLCRGCHLDRHAG